MALLMLHAGGQSQILARFSDAIAENLRDLSPILREVAKDIVFPAFARHYAASGLKQRTGAAKQAATQIGAKGNVLEIRPNGLTAGVSYQQMPYLRWIFEGRGPIRAKKAKALRFDVNGKPVFVKSVGAAPARPVVFLTEEEMEQIGHRITVRLMERGAQPVRK